MQIIAEIGSNWYSPDPQEAIKLALSAIWEARDAGATIVKFQVFTAASLYAKPEKRHLTPPTKAKLLSIYNTFKDLEFPVQRLPFLVREAHQAGLQLWASFFSVDLLERYGPQVDGIKIASGDITYHDLLDAAGRIASSYNIPLCASTGAATWDEIETMDNILGRHKRYVAMHCVSSYPAPESEMNISAITDLAFLRHAAATGLSDHSAGALASQLAIARGATYLEKHFRPSGARPNPDFDTSLPPAEFSAYVKGALYASTLIGRGKRDPNYKVSPIESDERQWARRATDNLRPNLSETF